MDMLVKNVFLICNNQITYRKLHSALHTLSLLTKDNIHFHNFVQDLNNYNKTVNAESNNITYNLLFGYCGCQTE